MITAWAGVFLNDYQSGLLFKISLSYRLHCVGFSGVDKLYYPPSSLTVTTLYRN